MGFFEALKRVLTHASRADAPDEARQRIRAAWGLEDEEPPGRSRPAGQQLSRAAGPRTTTGLSGRSGCDGSWTSCPTPSRTGTS